MKKLSRERRVQVLAALCEGCSIASTVRMTGVSKPTVLKLIMDMGKVCVNFEDEMLRDLPCSRIECDELWGFCGMKDRNVPKDRRGEYGLGSIWTWTAICAETKLLISWIMGDRDGAHADAFMDDLACRINTVRPQICTDGLGAYAPAIKRAFGTGGVHYAQVVKTYGNEQREEARYSPPKCVGCEKHAVFGNPDHETTGTSYVERANLTVRMSQRRWTRLTNGHSKSYCHMEASFAIHAFYFNWIRKHMTLKQTPAMAAGIADHVWTFGEMVDLLEAQEQAAIEAGKLKRGPYGPRQTP